MTGIAVVWLMNALGWAALAFSGGTWWKVVLAAVWLAVWHEQLAFIVHDAGHRRSPGPAGSSRPSAWSTGT